MNGAAVSAIRSIREGKTGGAEMVLRHQYQGELNPALERTLWLHLYLQRLYIGTLGVVALSGDSAKYSNFCSPLVPPPALRSLSSWDQLE